MSCKQIGVLNVAQLDEVMGTASAVAGRVGEQSQLFDNIGNKVLAVGAKFPAVNGIINAVRRKKSKVWPPSCVHAQGST